ncbi:3889_t:CDS:1 [Ambispora leptoticha]|uniref:3889_t:CDS:1 n=1 Tax=Ambispora leptoticha TaxID=144679 RepID=A0A9N9HRC2_9GLOM|nr:3889_t:CDS:1 [Ambispora leptoticha]
MTSLENESLDDASAISSTCSTKRQKNCGPNFDEIWSFYIKGPGRGNGHYKASCHYCSSIWERGKPQVMKAHLANHCKNCPENISDYWRRKLIEEADTIRSRTIDLQNVDCIPSEIKCQLDQSLLKAWVMAGIPFNVIKNPFIKDLFKKLKYDPPSRSTLSGWLLDAEVA